jgi:transposase InsO family protein
VAGGGPKKGAADPAQEAAEVSEETGVGLAACCRILRAPRSTIYARRRPFGGNSSKRGPRTAVSDDELLVRIREAIRRSPFSGEGHRKVTARLRREDGIHVGRKRVLRLMREAGLLAPQRARGRRSPRPHDGTIVPDAPNVLWGTDATMAYTAKDGWVWCFVAIDHHTAEAWASVARRGDRFAALEPIYDAVRDRFGQLAPDVARGISCRHDWGPQYTSSHFTGSLAWLGICDSRPTSASPLATDAPSGSSARSRSSASGRGLGATSTSSARPCEPSSSSTTPSGSSSGTVTGLRERPTSRRRQGSRHD